MKFQIAIFLSLITLSGVFGQIELIPQVYIQKYKSLPDLYLSPEEVATLNLDEYFQGFNLTFKGDHVVQKYDVIDTSSLELNGSEVKISKYFQSDDLIRIINYQPPNQFSWTQYSLSNKAFIDANYLSLGQQILGCRDFAFYNSTIAIGDCFTQNSEVFIVVNMLSDSVSNITNNLIYRGGKTGLIPSNGYFLSSIIAYETGSDWFFALIQFDFVDNSISWSNLYNQNSVSGLQENFTLSCITTWDEETLLITSKNQLVFISSDQAVGNIIIGGENVDFNIMNGPFRISSLYTSLLFNGHDGIYEVILNSSLKVVALNSYSLPYKSQIVSLAQTDSFISCISIDAIQGYYQTIYERGNSDSQLVFFTKKLQGKSFTLSIQGGHGNEGFFLIRRKVHAIQTQSPKIRIENTFGDAFTLTLEVWSLGQFIKETSKVNQLMMNDAQVYTLQNKKSIVRNVNTSSYIALNEIFLGPVLNFSCEFGETENGYFYNDESYLLNLPPQNYTFGKVKLYQFDVQVFVQTATAPTVLDLYVCTSDRLAKTYDCNLTASGEIGAVNQMYTTDNYDLLVIENEPNNMSIYMIEEMDLNDSIIITENCNLVYLSHDNLLEQTTYCVKDQEIEVYLVKNHHYTWNVGQKISKILTNIKFPGLVFISSHYHLFIYSTNFFVSDPVKINTLELYEKYDFILTEDSIVVILLQSNHIVEYDVRNPKEIIFKKRYMQFYFDMQFSPKAFAYSEFTDTIYIIGQTPYETTSILGYQTNMPGNSNLQYMFDLGNVQPSSVILDASYYQYSMDVLLILDNEQPLINLITDFPYLVLITADVQNATALFETSTFNITAQSLLNTMAEITVTSTLVNTQRQVTLKENITVPSLELANVGGESNVSFKGEDIFEGPAYYVHLSLDYDYDNIVLTNRIESQSISLDMPVVATAQNGIFVSILTSGSIKLYDFEYFPEAFHLNTSIPFYCGTSEIAMDNSSMLASCGDDMNNNYFTHIDLKDTSKTCNFTVDYCLEEIFFKIHNEYIFVLVPLVFKTLQIYKLDSNQCAVLIHTVSIYELSLKPAEVSYSLDAYTSTSTNTTFIFITTASTIFKTIILKSGQKPVVTAFNNLYRLVAPDHFDLDQTIFSGIKLHSVMESQTGNFIFEVLVSSLNAFSYLILCSMDYSGQYQSCYIRKGFIQYQTYNYKTNLFATSRYFGLLASSTKNSRTDFFLYDLQSTAYLPYHFGTYPTFDSFQAMPAPEFTDTPALMFDKGNYHVMLFYDSLDIEFDEYIILDKFSIYSNASHISSPTVQIVGKNDFWSVEYGLPIVNYGAIFRGVSSLFIVLVVFFSVVVLFFIFVCVNRYFRFKAKRTLKDEMNFVNETYFKMDREDK